jgi:hypothetical protein
LLSSLPRGEPLSTAALQARGLSAFRASALARSGWLVHLARGVYMLPGDTLTRDGSLAFLSEQTPGLHVGGKTALAWRSVRQNIAFREHLNLWGDTPRRLPEWFTQRFPASYQATQLFDDALCPRPSACSPCRQATRVSSSPCLSAPCWNCSATSERFSPSQRPVSSSRACPVRAGRYSTGCR